MIFTSFFRSLGQITDPRFLRVLFLGVGLTLAFFIGISAGVFLLLEAFIGDTVAISYLGEVPWVEMLLGVGGVFLFVVLSIWLMMPVASAVISMFLEDVAAAVEARHYPHLPQVAPIPFWDTLRDTLNFLGVLVAANLLAILLYVSFTPAASFIFLGLNGFLLGREYFTLVAMRRIGRAGAKALRRKHSGTIWLAGILMAIPLTIPIANLVIPVLGAATFTHLFHALHSEGPNARTNPSHGS